MLCLFSGSCVYQGYGDPDTESPSLDVRRVLGLWDSSFGPVKIALDTSRGGKHLMGVWVYQRDNKEVIGYFSGPVRGFSLSFYWQEPAQPEPLRGSGTLVFDRRGTSFAGQWWSDKGDRQGEWRGWRPNTVERAVEPPPSRADP